MAEHDDRLRTVDEHLAIVLDGIGSLDPIELTLMDAQGLILAENVITDVPLPGFDNSAIDGYAVRAVDTKGAEEDKPVTLPVVGDVAAGEARDLRHGRRSVDAHHDRRADSVRSRRGDPTRMD